MKSKRQFLEIAGLLIVLVMSGVYFKNSKFFIQSTDLSNVVIGGYHLDISKDYKVDGDLLNITKKDVESTIGMNYSDTLYDYGQLFYKMTYYDKKNHVELECVYFDGEEKRIRWLNVKSGK